MALTTTQINQAYIAILGRAAIGTESRVAGDASVSDVAASLIAAKANNSEDNMFTTLADKVLAEGKDINSMSNADFVESLYLTLLNRDTSNDAEGKEFWLSALNNGASRKDLVASFTNAVIAQKAANTQDYQNYAAKAVAQSDAFVESLYTKLLGRTSDEAGKAYWSGLIADGASYADVVASFAAAAFSQGKETEDGVTIANKLEVADYATANLTSFSKLTTEQDIEEIKARLEQAIANTKSNAEAVADAKKTIDSDANTYKAPGSVSFTKKEGEELGVDANSGKYNTTKATDFNGTINISDATKSTIHKSDKISANPEFADGSILTVNVTGATKEKNTLDLTDLPAADNINGVSNLVINAGTTAAVSGAISTNFTKTVTINAGYISKDVGNASDITVSHTLDTYTAGDQADKLTVNTSGKIANIKMGAGNDTIILKAGGTPAKVTNIDAGAGIQDTLQLTVDAATVDYSSIKSITGVEIIELTGANNNTSGAKIAAVAVDGENITLKSAVNGSGTLTIDMTDADSLNISSFKNDTTKAVAGVTITGVASNDTITLSTATDDSKIAETIALATAENVTINGFATNSDKIKLAAGVDGSNITNNTKLFDVGGGNVSKVVVGAFAAATKIIGEDGKVATELAQVFDAATAAFTAASQKGYIAQVKDNKTYLYEITNDGTTATKIDVNDHVKLIATFDSTLAHGDFIA